MPFMKSMKADAGVADIYKARSKIYLHWIRMGEEVMTKESPLSQGERELIATYVSSLNDCDYCRAAHLPSMMLHGIRPETIDAILEHRAAAPIEQKMRPIFAFVKKLTLAPVTLTQADADAVFEAGWDEEALHTAIAVTCRFSFMNRLVMGHGLKPPDLEAALENAKRRLEHGYAGMHPELSKGGQQGV
jgi:uncharacterized peroxidase-related enzyme